MCTVTFIPGKKSVYLASNRDEHLRRPAAIVPEFYRIGHKNILFPKDPQGGGTWIAADEFGNVAILLNGANKPHQSQPPYHRSRGLVLLDLIAAYSPKEYFMQSDFDDIEPFTIVLFENKKLFSGWWDSKEKYLRQFDESKPHIWSSATLYNNEAVKKREELLHKWIEKHKENNTDSIMDFHRNAGEEEHTICRSKELDVFTNSISAIEIENKKFKFTYLDLQTGLIHQHEAPIQEIIPVT